MHDFGYHRPASAADAAGLLAKSGDAKIVAGGMTLIPTLKQRLAQPSDLVDLGGIAELKGVKAEAGGITIGAMTTHADVARSADVQKAIPALAVLAEGIGDPQVRNRGTIGGSVAHGDPASDWPAALLAANGEVVARGPSGERVIAITNFLVDTFETALKPDELVTELRVPLAGQRSGGAYEKLERKVGDYAVVGVGVQLILDAGGNVASVGIGLCNVGPKSIKATAAESFLRGQPPAPDNLNEAAKLAMDASQPITDDRGPADYKRAMVRVLTVRALQRALARAQGGTR